MEKIDNYRARDPEEQNSEVDIMIIYLVKFPFTMDIHADQIITLKTKLLFLELSSPNAYC